MLTEGLGDGTGFGIEFVTVEAVRQVTGVRGCRGERGQRIAGMAPCPLLLEGRDREVQSVWSAQQPPD